MTITLTPEQEQIIQEQITSGKYTDPSDLISQALQLLLERDQANQKLEGLLIASLESGDPIVATDEWWDSKKASLTEKHQNQ
ncbi:MAG: type II toxin-antitoxin system ParD family antitoxin [Synechococcales cyanobacterium RM1_1_8]|nr:type II toxin-antitoxin system ParD family antitoxin [Synechococcales cyanobacterium RM1_1_8]